MQFYTREEAGQMLSKIVRNSQGESSMEVEERRAVKELNEIIKPLEKRLVRLRKARDLILGADAVETKASSKPARKKPRGVPGVLQSHLINLFKQVPTAGLTAKEATTQVMATTDYKFINGQNEQNIVRSCIVRMVQKKKLTKIQHDDRGMVYYLERTEKPTKVSPVETEEDRIAHSKAQHSDRGKTFDSERAQE